MAVAFVRSVGTPVTATGTTTVLTMGASATTIGNVLVAFVICSTAFAPGSVTDSAGNSYALAASRVLNSVGVAIFTSLTTAQVAATTGTITADWGGSSRIASMVVAEFSGSDGTIGATNSGSAAATDVPPTTSVTTLWNASCVLKITGTTVSATLDTQPSTNFTATGSKVSSIPSFYCEHSIIGAGVAARAQGTAQWTSATGNVATLLAELKVTGATQPPIRVAQRVVTRQAIAAGAW